MNLCARIATGLSESDRAVLRRRFENASDFEKFAAVSEKCESQCAEVSRVERRDKSDAWAQKLLHSANEHRDALKNLNEALAFAMDQNLIREILDERKKLKLRHQNTEKFSDLSRWTEKIFKGPSESISALSRAVQLDHSSDLGRQLIATEQLEPGFVLGAEEPLASVLHPSCKFSHCAECFARCRDLVPCQRCTQALYCGESCRASAARHHRLECQAAGDLEMAGLSPVDMLAVRLLSLHGPDEVVRIVRNGDAPDDLGAFLRTYSDPGCWSFEEMLQMGVKACLVLRAFGLQQHPDVGTLGHFLLRALHGMPLIAHEISERCEIGSQPPSDHCVGVAVFAALSLLNHSCDPNVVRHNCGRGAVLRAVRRVAPGEPLLDSYGPHFVADDAPARRRLLRERFRFECACRACRLALPTQQRLPWELPGCDQVGQQVHKAVRTYVGEGRVDHDLVGDLERGVVLLDTNQLRMCQFYFVMQQMLKVIYASQSNFYSTEF